MNDHLKSQVCSLKLSSHDPSRGVAMSLIMLMRGVAFQGAVYLESGLTPATLLFTNLAFDEQVSFALSWCFCLVRCLFVV